MTDPEFRRYIREIMRGIETVRRYGNWAVSPWLVKKYGIDRVEGDLQAKLGKQYHIRIAVYKPIGRAEKTGKYYILEDKDGRKKKGRSTTTGGTE